MSVDERGKKKRVKSHVEKELLVHSIAERMGENQFIHTAEKMPIVGEEKTSV